MSGKEKVKWYYFVLELLSFNSPPLNKTHPQTQIYLHQKVLNHLV